MDDTEKKIRKPEDEKKKFNDDFEDYYEEEYYDSYGGGYDNWDDQSTWGQNRGFCDMADNCYECPYANRCF